jgi:cadmium resistance protein CadD (predicted permease)
MIRQVGWMWVRLWTRRAAVIGFAVPYVFSSALKLQHVYLVIYFVVVLALFAAYTVATRLDLGEVVRRHWKLGLALGLVRCSPGAADREPR